MHIPASSPPLVHDFEKGQVRDLDLRAILLSLILTAALFGLVLSITTQYLAGTDTDQTLVVFSDESVLAKQIMRDLPGPADEPDVVSTATSETKATSSPKTLAPAPYLPVAPAAPITLTPVELPEIATTGPALFDSEGAVSDGNQMTGPAGPNGAGGDGRAGSGAGGSGNGAGGGVTLTASWAPTMNFNEFNRRYPDAAKGTGIEGVAVLKCMALRRDLVRDCSLVAENPSGYGFGQAALNAERALRVRVHNQHGKRVYNEWIIFEAHFRSSEPKAKGSRD